MVIKQAEHTTAQAAELTAAELTADGPPKTAGAPMTAGALRQWRGGGDIAALCAATGAAGESVLISGGDRAKRWNPVTGEPAGRPPAGHHGNVTALVSMPGDGLSTALASGAADGTVRVWNLEAAQPIAAFTVQHAADGLRSAASASQPAHAIPAAPDESRSPTTAGGQDQLRGRVVRALCALENVHGRPLLAAAAGRIIQVWDPLEEEPLAILESREGIVTAVCPIWPGTTATGRALLASGTEDGAIMIWNPSTWQTIGELPGHVGAVHALCPVSPGPSGPMLASAGDDGAIRLWNPLAATAGAVLTGHAGPVTTLCTLTSPTGSVLLASGGADGNLRIWNPHTGRSAGTPIVAHREPIVALCEFPDWKGASMLASADTTGLIRIWDPRAATEPPARTNPPRRQPPKTTISTRAAGS